MSDLDAATFLPVFLALLALAVLGLLLWNRPARKQKPWLGSDMDKPRQWPPPEPPRKVQVDTRFDRARTILHDDNVRAAPPPPPKGGTGAYRPDADTSGMMTNVLLMHAVIGPGSDDYGRNKPAPDGFGGGPMPESSSHDSSSSSDSGSSDGGSCGGCD